MTDKIKARLVNIFELFKTNNPRSLDEIKALGIKVKKIGEGAYRKVYKITGVPLVIKIPFPYEVNSLQEAINHARCEYKTIRSIKRFKKFAKLKRYMPEVYHFDNKSGIILTHFYKKIPHTYSFGMARMLSVIVDLIWPDAQDGDCDVHGNNIGLDEENQPVVIDLGYFSELGREQWNW